MIQSDMKLFYTNLRCNIVWPIRLHMKSETFLTKSLCSHLKILKNLTKIYWKQFNIIESYIVPISTSKRTHESHIELGWVCIIESVAFLDGIRRNGAKRYNSETFLARIVPMVSYFFACRRETAPPWFLPFRFGSSIHTSGCFFLVIFFECKMLK